MSEDAASKKQHLLQQTLSFLKKSCDSKATAEFLGKFQFISYRLIAQSTLSLLLQSTLCRNYSSFVCSLCPIILINYLIMSWCFGGGKFRPETLRKCFYGGH